MFGPLTAVFIDPHVRCGSKPAVGDGDQYVRTWEKAEDFNFCSEIHPPDIRSWGRSGSFSQGRSGPISHHVEQLDAVLLQEHGQDLRALGPGHLLISLGPG